MNVKPITSAIHTMPLQLPPLKKPLLFLEVKLSAMRKTTSLLRAMKDGTEKWYFTVTDKWKY